jgi:cobaltochelatase CobS
MTTIQNIIDRNTSREAKKIMREVINTECTAGGYNWGDVIVAARNSLLINSAHENSKKLSAMPTQAQLLDRMSTKALGIFIVQMVHDEGNCVETLRSAFEQPADYMEAWPYGDNIAMDFEWIYGEFDHLDISELVSERDPSAAPTRIVLSKPSARAIVDDDEDDAPAPTPLPVFNPALVTAANNVISVATEGAFNDLEDMIAHRLRQDERIIELEKAASAAPVVQPVVSDGTIPNGRPKRRNAQSVFHWLTDPLLDFEIDCWEWDDTNPLVPVLDTDYVFDIGVLADLLWARENNKNAWLVGHTGTGKTTLVEQIMARTMSMFERVNFDSAITRVDFIGKVDVRVVNGASETYFKEGILPRAMRMPVTLLLDEADAIRGDIAYVLQPVLEGRPLRLLEDAGRMVEPHPQFRIMAAANSGGSGDSSGLYSAAVKVQSRAAMNRYNVFVRVNYMEAPEEMALVRKHVPDLSDAASDIMLAFLTNYRKGFADGEITTPISPRNMLTLGSYVAAFEPRIGFASALERGLDTVIFQSIDDNDAPVVRGIADRVTP